MFSHRECLRDSKFAPANLHQVTLDQLFNFPQTFVMGARILIWASISPLPGNDPVRG